MQLVGKFIEVHLDIRNGTLVSYTPKKNKCVLLLWTMHNDDAIDPTSAETKKP